MNRVSLATLIPMLLAWAPAAPAAAQTFSSSELWFDAGPCWSVAVGTAFLHRNDARRFPLVVDPNDGSQLMGSYDLRPGWGSGPRVEITRQLRNGRSLEVVGLVIDNWANNAEAHDGKTVTGESWDQYVFDDIRASYGTDLYGLECNVRWPLFGSPFLTGLAGFRWAELQEEFSTFTMLTQGQATLTNTGTLTLDNHLYGFQLGMDALMWAPRLPLRVDGVLKAGIYGTHADWLLVTTGDLDNRRWEKQGCHTSFIGELGLKATYQFPVARCWCWSLFAEYEVLWLTDVATAEQLKREIAYDTAFYHGLFVGLEIPFGCCPPPGK